MDHDSFCGGLRNPRLATKLCAGELALAANPDLPVRETLTTHVFRKVDHGVKVNMVDWLTRPSAIHGQWIFSTRMVKVVYLYLCIGIA